MFFNIIGVKIKKNVYKYVSGCAIGAYGDINYEFLTSNGEFISFAQCGGDKTLNDFDKINGRYDSDELLTQHDLNFHILIPVLMLVVFNLYDDNPWNNLDMSKAELIVITI